MPDITAIGELLIDFAMTGTGEDGYPAFEAHPGGAPANFLAAAVKAGCSAAFIGKVGADAFGEKLIATLQEAGVQTRGIIKSPEVFTTLAFVTLDEKGERSFSFARKPGADTRLCFEECDLTLVEEAKLVHFGTLSLTDEPARFATKQLIAHAKARGKRISFDPNLRKPLWSDLNEAKSAMLWGLGQADIVKISDDEVDFLWGLSPEAGAERILQEYACKLVFVTCGAHGAVYANKNALGRVKPIAGIHAIDTTGAGDIFGGTAAALLLKSGLAPEMLHEEVLAALTRFACTAASLSCQKKGGIPSIPTRAEVLRALEEQPTAL